MHGDGSKGGMVLFHDTFNNFNTPNVAIAATRLLPQNRVIVCVGE